MLKIPGPTLVSAGNDPHMDDDVAAELPRHLDRDLSCALSLGEPHVVAVSRRPANVKAVYPLTIETCGQFSELVFLEDVPLVARAYDGRHDSLKIPVFHWCVGAVRHPVFLQSGE